MCGDLTPKSEKLTHPLKCVAVRRDKLEQV
jgi:hypothetical protein